MRKKILILYEKSEKIGMGHYHRCLRLKELLKEEYKVKLSNLVKKRKISYLSKSFDLTILDLKTYPNIKTLNKTIIFEDLNKKNKNILSINPLDIYIKNSGPDYFIFPKGIDNIKYNFDKKKRINILFLQGAKDSNNQLNKLINYVLRNNKKIDFRFKIISKKFNGSNLFKNIKILNFYKSPCTIYKNIQIAISSVGNSSFELGRIGIPTIHHTIERREIKRAKIFEKLNIGIFINNNLKKIINELNRIYFDDNYRKKLIKTRKVFFKKKNKLLKLIKNEI